VAIRVTDVLHYLFTPLGLEVNFDIDVVQLASLYADEALEQHGYAGGIDLGNAETVADGRVCRRIAAAIQDALVAHPVDISAAVTKFGS
jgi:hypothetical protein